MKDPAELNIDHKNLYWTLQIVGWLFFFIVFTAFGYGLSNLNIGLVIINYIWISSVGFAISHLYRNHIKKNEWHRLSIGRITMRILLITPLMATLWLIIVLPLSLFISSSLDELSVGVFIAMVFNLSIILFIWNLIYFFYKLFTSYKQSEIEKWKLMAAVKDAQLIALKSQINPHFIFNSLNNIRSLVIENPEKAREMITHLSSLLRYSVQFNNAEKVSLRNEIDIVKYYLNLESIQFEDRLRFRLNVDERSLSQEIPPMAIQMLVENAIKHGISKLPEGGEVEVECKVVDEELVVQVINTGQIEVNGTPDTGIGLRNATERLKLLFGKLSELTLENLDNNQVRAKFVIPTNN